MKIDGKDIFKSYGAMATMGTYSALFKYPKRTAVAYRDYAERDGIIPDLRKMEFEPKKVDLPFYISHKSEDEFRHKYQMFFDGMTAPGYRTVDVENLSFSLRYSSTNKYSVAKAIKADSGTVFTMQFLEDKHSIADVHNPVGAIVGPSGTYKVNGIDFAEFGVTGDGEIGEVLKYPDVKEPFYDYAERAHFLSAKTLKHKQITIKLCMRAKNKAEFINNHAAFFNQFNRPGKQQLYIKEIGGITEVYYIDCPSYTVHWSENGAIWAKFSITLVVPVVTWLSGQTSILTVLYDVGYGLLADENGNVIAFV